MSVTLKVKMTGGGNEFTVSADLSKTIAELKEQIATLRGIPKENIRLVCAGKIWQDVATLESYKPQEGASVHCLNNPPRAAPPPAEAQTLRPVDPMQAMMGGLGAAPPAAAGGDSLSQMMAQSQAMMRNNPDMMAEMMNSPMMQSMLSNPEMMRNIMRMDPRLNQAMEQNPEMARMLEDPEIINQSLQMMRNPSLMREMQRNSDRAIGNLDVMPGGHNALVRAHSDVLDPLMNALTGPGENNTSSVDAAAYAGQSQGNPNNEALPNPWGAPAATNAAASTPAATTPAAANPAATPFGGFPAFGAQPPAGGNGQSDPMAGMMQQMMSNPAMMQQSMQMAQQMFGGGAGQQPGLFGAQGGQHNVETGTQPQTPAAQTDPMAAMMQQMMSNPAMMQQSMQMAQQQFGGQAAGAPGATAATTTDAQPAAPPADPMAAMMQQMMSNPAMMQQSMQMANQMFGQRGGYGGGFPALPMQPAAGQTETAAVPPANPMAAMMQQMMSNPEAMQRRMQMMQQNNPEAMQRRMQMMQQMFGSGAGQPGMMGAQGFPGATPTPAPDPTASPATEAMARARFAAQLAQLSAMGFANEAACLRALQQHHGRVDAAIDSLLASGEGAA